MTTPSIEAKYEVLGKIKEGGMGAIYKVRHTALDELRVVKVMRPQLEDDPEAQRRFRNEAKMATSLRHPNIAALLDFTEDPGKSFYMVMEFIDGVTLLELLNRSGPPPLPTALEIAVQSLEALSYLHRRGIVHRDISPENLMVTRDADGKLLVKLIDLGVAKQTDAEGATKTGAFLGKLKYASPEQLGRLRASEKLDGRSDLYSLGCVLYQLVTGATPFDARSPEHYILLHLSRAPRPFQETDPSDRIPAELREAILKALAKNRKLRWPTAADFASALREIQARLVARDGPELPGGLPPGLGTLLSESAPTLDRTSEIDDVARMLGEAFSGATPAPSQAETLARTPTSILEPPSASVEPPQATPVSTVRGERRLPASAAVAAAVLAVAATAWGLWPRRAEVSRQTPGGPSVATALPATSGVPPGTAAVVDLPARMGETGRPTESGTLLVLAAPWAEVEVRTDQDPAVTHGSAAATPLRMELPAGRYVVRYRWAGAATPLESVVEVRPGERTEALGRRPGFDLERAVADYVP